MRNQASDYRFLNQLEYNFWTNQIEEIAVIFTRPSMEISTKTHLLELSTVIHVVKNQINASRQVTA